MEEIRMNRHCYGSRDRLSCFALQNPCDAQPEVNGSNTVGSGDDEGLRRHPLLSRILLPCDCLGRCSGAALFSVGVVSRLVILAWMLASRYLTASVVAPMLFGSGTPTPLEEVSYDSCESFYDAIFQDVAFLNHWDSVHFRYVADRGYSHEHVHAFFPGAAAVFKVLDHLSLPAITYNALGIMAYSIALVALRELTRHTAIGKKLHGTAVGHRWLGGVCFAFLLSPTNVFTVVSYTESFFACFCFLGLYCAAKDDTTRFPAGWFFGALASFMMSATFRSNGFLMGVVMMLPLVWQFMSQPLQVVRRQGGRRWLIASATRGLLCVVLLAPYVVSNVEGWRRYCQPSADASGPPSTVSSCTMLGFYQMIQSKYWNVGWFRQWTVQNLPNFFIAGPSIFLGMRAMLRCSQTLSSIEKSMTKSHHASQSRRRKLLWCSSLWCNAALLVFLYYLAITTIHVQVVNRLVFACPALYWMVGLQFAHEPRSLWSAVYVAYALVCSTLGPLMFSHHMNWT